MIKVNPCPFCKSKKIGYSLKTHGHYDRIYHAAMYCKDCNAYGPRVIVHPGDRTRDEIQTDKTYQMMAVNLWNKAETPENIVGGIFGDWKKGGKK